MFLCNTPAKKILLLICISMLSQSVWGYPLPATDKASSQLFQVTDETERQQATFPVVMAYLRASEPLKAASALSQYRNNRQSAIAVRILEKAATTLIDEKRVTEAIKLIQNTENQTEKYILAQDIMYGLLTPQSLNQALLIPEWVNSSLSQSRLIGLVASFYTSEQEYLKAAELIQTIQDPNEKEARLIELATDSAKHGQPQQTWTTVRQIQNSSAQSEILETLANYHIRKSELDEAILCSTFSRDPQLSRFWVAQKQSIKLAVNNQCGEAIAMAKDIPNADIKGDTLYYLAALKMQKGEEGLAQELANSAPKITLILGCQTYCQALSEDGKLAQCMGVISRISPNENQQELFLNLAEHLGKHADHHEVLLYLRQWPDPIRDQAYESFAVSWSKYRFNLEKVGLFLDQISSVPIRLRATLTILDNLSQKNTTQSVSFAAEMLPGIYKVTALLRLATQFRDTGNKLRETCIGKAHDIAMKFDPAIRDEALLLVGNELANLGQLQRNSKLMDRLYKDIDEKSSTPKGAELKLALAKLLLRINEKDASLDLYRQLPFFMKLSYMAEAPPEWQKNQQFVEQLN